MKITFSPLIAAASGRTADLVASSWKGQAYIRKAVTPHNPRSPAQVAQRNAMSECVGIWHLLSGMLKGAYGLGATPYNISGFNDFCKLNVVALKNEEGLFGPRRNDEQESPYIEIPTDFAYDSEPGAGQMTFTWTDPGQGEDYRLGIIVYNATLNIIEYMNLNVNALSLGTQVTPSGEIGENMLIAAMVQRASDNEVVHFGSVSHEQAS